MTAASRGPILFSFFSENNDLLYRTRREPFLFSVLGQAALLAIITYFTSCLVTHPPDGVHPLSNFGDRFLIFAGHKTAVVAEAWMLYTLHTAICRELP